jgi:hypothetical protein
VFFGPVLAVAFWLVGRHRWPSIRSGLIVIGVGWLYSMFVGGVAAFMTEGSSIDPASVIWLVEVVGMVVTTVVAIAVARRTPHKSSPSEPGLQPRRPDIG